MYHSRCRTSESDDNQSEVFIQNHSCQIVSIMSQGTASDHTGDTNEFFGDGNGYKGIISLLEVLKKVDQQAIFPPGTSLGAPGPSRGQPPSVARRPPNLPRRDHGSQPGQVTQRARLNRSGFRKRTREVRCRYDLDPSGMGFEGEDELKERISSLDRWLCTIEGRVGWGDTIHLWGKVA